MNQRNKAGVGIIQGFFVNKASTTPTLIPGHVSLSTGSPTLGYAEDCRVISGAVDFDAEVAKRAQELLLRTASQAVSNTQAITVSKAIAEFLASRGFKGNRKKSLENYRSFFARFFSGDELVPTEHKAIEGRLAQYNRNTRNTYYLYLLAFYNFLQAEHDIPNPMRKIERPGTDKTLPTHFNPEERRQLEDVKLSPRDRALIEVLKQTAVRPGEVVGSEDGHPLRFSDIYDDHLQVFGKTGERVVPAAPELCYLLRALRDGRPADSAIFLADRGAPLSGSGLRKVVRRAFKAAGINAAKAHPYTLRHSFADDFLDKGGDLGNLQQILGHRKIETTIRYTHISPKQMLDTYRRVRGAEYSLYSAPQSTQLEGDPAQLIPELLDRLVALGDLAKQISRSLGSNGHKAAKLEDIKEYLQRQASK